MVERATLLRLLPTTLKLELLMSATVEVYNSNVLEGRAASFKHIAAVYLSCCRH